jgi:hypothetical protein
MRLAHLFPRLERTDRLVCRERAKCDMSGVPSGPSPKAANEISDTNTSTHILSFSTVYPEDIGPTYVLLPDKIAFLFPSLPFLSIPFGERQTDFIICRIPYCQTNTEYSAFRHHSGKKVVEEIRIILWPFSSLSFQITSWRRQRYWMFHKSLYWILLTVYTKLINSTLIINK